jgi:hypothetical protein
MFGLFGKRRESPREGIRKDYERVMDVVRRSPPAAQVAVGHNINLVNSMFVKRFRTIAAFQALPENERLGYIESLTKAEAAVAKEPPAAVAFALFKMWVAAISANDAEMIEHVSKGISELSRKGDLGG